MRARITLSLFSVAAIAGLVACRSILDEPLVPLVTSLRATAGLEEVVLEWPASDGATGYVVLVGTGGDGAVDDRVIPVATSPVLVTLRVTPLQGRLPAFFAVRAVASTGPLAPSPVVRAVPLARGIRGLAPLDVPAWSVTSPVPETRYGFPAIGAGDVNGDGFDDMIVGEYTYKGGYGRAHLYLGAAGVPSTVAAWTTTGQDGGWTWGASLAALGDVNGDGFDDVLIGSPGASLGSAQEGAVFLFHGDATAGLVSAGWSVEGNQYNSFYGRFVGAAGDVNGDGLPDLLVGAQVQDVNVQDDGFVSLFLNTGAGFAAAPTWVSTGGQLIGERGWGLSVNSGDADGDGFDDVLFGEHNFDGDPATDGRVDEGAALLFRGGSSLPSATPLWRTEGNQTGAFYGEAISFAGDVNADGYDDVLVGAYGYGAEDGRAYLYPGSPTGPSTATIWTAYGQEDNARLGFAVAGAGDVNADGYADILLGSYAYGTSNQGRAFLYLGGADGPDDSQIPNWDVSGDVPDAFLGGSVASAGDVNGDGSADILIGTQGRYDEPTLGRGSAAMFFGPPSAGPTVMIATPIVAGRTLTLDATTFADPAAGTPHRCRVEWGDGNATDLADCAPASLGSLSHTYDLTGPVVVRIRVENDYRPYDGEFVFGEAVLVVRVGAN